MKKIVHYFRVLILGFSFLASAFLCGCESQKEFNHWYKSGDSSIDHISIPKYGITGIKTVMITHPDGYTNKASSFNFILGILDDEMNLHNVFDSYCSDWNFFPNVYLKDVDNDGENELIVEVPHGMCMENSIINIYRYFPEAEFDEPHFLAIDKPIHFFSKEYEFKDGKLIIKNEGNYKNGKPIPTRVYRIERYKIVMESGDEDWRNEYFFLRPPRKESEWLELKKKYDKIRQESSQ